MAMPFRPYGNPPAFDLEEYKDAFEAWEAQWKVFLRLSNIDTGVEASARPSYKANIIKSSLSRHTLTVLERSGLTEAQLDDPDAITEYLRARANAGRNRHVWRQRFGNRVQRPNEALDDWLCDLWDIARKCDSSSQIAARSARRPTSSHRSSAAHYNANCSRWVTPSHWTQPSPISKTPRTPYCKRPT